jgi:hypothetical protein
MSGYPDGNITPTLRACILFSWYDEAMEINRYPYPNRKGKNLMTSKAKAPKAPKQKVTITIPAINTAWTTLVAKTQKIDGDATSAVIAFAKVIASRKVDIRNARKSVEELGTKSPILLTSQIEALPTLLALLDKGKGFEAFHALDIKAKLTKATASYKLGVGIAVAMPSWEAVQKEVTAFNKRKNSAKPKASTSKESKESKGKKISIDEALKSAIALVEAVTDGIEDSTYDLIVELHKSCALKIGVDA